MISFSSKLTRKYATELNLLYKYRKFSDGIDFLSVVVNLDRYEGDHKPSFQIGLILLNFVILEFEIYNMHHQCTGSNGEDYSLNWKFTFSSNRLYLFIQMVSQLSNVVIILVT